MVTISFLEMVIITNAMLFKGLRLLNIVVRQTDIYRSRSSVTFQAQITAVSQIIAKFAYD